LLTVRISGLRGSIYLDGILDTGAVECVLPYEVFEEIGPPSRDEAGTVVGFDGTEQEVVYASINLTFPPKRDSRTWHAKVGFAIGREGKALWGHIGFLQYFNAAFYGAKRQFTLEFTDKLPASMSLPGS